MGIKTIMQANKILMVASGEDKAEIVKRAFFGPITPEVPASVLQLHNDVTLVGDEAALSLIGSKLLKIPKEKKTNISIKQTQSGSWKRQGSRMKCTNMKLRKDSWTAFP